MPFQLWRKRIRKGDGIQSCKRRDDMADEDEEELMLVGGARWGNMG